MRVVVVGLLAAAALYALLLIPEASPPSVQGAGKEAFVWNRDAFWSELEAQFVRAKSAGAGTLAAPISESLARIPCQLDLVAAADLPANAPVFEALEAGFFQLGPMVAAESRSPAGLCPGFRPDAQLGQTAVRALADGGAGDPRAALPVALWRTGGHRRGDAAGAPGQSAAPAGRRRRAFARRRRPPCTA